MKNCEPPNVEGTWSVTEYKVTDGVNTICNPEKIKYTVTFRQNGRFVDAQSPYCLFYGVWKTNKKSEWELILVNNSQNNDTYFLNPICVDNKNIAYKLDYVNFEAGTNPNNCVQKAQVSFATYKRIC